jgi:hypothetical protein
MASIHKEIQVQRSLDAVWNAIRDVGAIHKRLVPGFVVDCRLEGDSRHLTFGNGMTIREIIVDVDDQRCRHSWSARGEPFTHHNASIQVFAEGDNACRLVWIADVMPHEIAGTIAAMMQQGLSTMKATLEGRTVDAPRDEWRDKVLPETRPWHQVERSLLVFAGAHGHVSEYHDISNLNDLREQVRRNGGQIVVFKSCLSAVFATWVRENAVWIAPGESSMLRGFVHSLPTLLCGWASLFGLFIAPMAMCFNLSGGRDVTQLLLEPIVPGSEEYNRIARTLHEEEPRQSRRWELALLLIVAAAFVCTGLALIDWKKAKPADFLPPWQ